jgi:hypothetical protein
MEYRASDTGTEEPRYTGPEEPRYTDEVGRKDFMFGTSIMLLLIVAAIVAAIVA